MTQLAHSSPISGIDVCDRWVATAGYDNRVILWDKRTRMARAILRHDHLANSCLFLDRGALLASCGSDYTVRFWSTDQEPWLRAVYSGHEDDVEMVADCPSKQLIATASRDSTVHIVGYDGRCRARLLGHRSDVNAVFWLGDRKVLSASNDGTVRVWNAQDGSTDRVIDLGAEDCDAVIASPSGHVFAGNDSGDIIRLDDEGQQRIPCHSAGIKRLALSADGQLLASLSYDQTLIVWRVSPDGGLVRIRETPFPAVVWARACAFHDEQTLAFGTFGTAYALYDFTADRWDLSGVEPTWGVNAVSSSQGDILAVGDAGFVSRGGRIVASVGSLCNFIGDLGGKTIVGGQLGRAYTVADGRVIYEHHSPLNCCCPFSFDGQQVLVIGAYSGELILLEENGSEIRVRKVISVHSNAIKDVCAAGESLVTVSADASIAIIDAARGTVEATISGAHRKIANGCVALAGDECQFASVGRDRMLKLWKGSSPTPVETPHTHSIRAIAYSRSSQTIATGSYSGDLWVYDPAEKRGISFSRLSTSGISSLTWRSADDTFVAGSYDGFIYVAAARTGELLSRFKAFGR